MDQYLAGTLAVLGLVIAVSTFHFASLIWSFAKRTAERTDALSSRVDELEKGVSTRQLDITLTATDEHGRPIRHRVTGHAQKVEN